MIDPTLNGKHLFHAILLLTAIIFSASFSSTAFAKRTPEESFKYQKHMAQAGYRSAIYKLAEMYKDGNGTPQDLNKALELYRQAAEKGYKPAKKRIPEVLSMIESGNSDSTNGNDQKLTAERQELNNKMEQLRKEMEKLERESSALEKRQ